MSVKKRLKLYQESIGLSDYKLERMMNKSKGWISLCDRPTSENIKKILETLPDLSAEWLIRGEGSMLINDDDVASNTAYPEEYYQLQLEQSDILINKLEKELSNIKIQAS